MLQFLWHYWKHLLKFCLCISVIFNVAFLWYTKVTLLLHSILIVCMASLINGERTPFGIFIFKFLEYVIPGCYLKDNVIEKKKLMLKDSKNWRKRFHMVLKYFNNKVNSQMGIFGAFFSMWNYFGEITAIDALHYLVQWMTQCYIVISCYNSQLHFLYNTNESIGNYGVTQCDTDVPLGLNVTHWCLRLLF